VDIYRKSFRVAFFHFSSVLGLMAASVSLISLLVRLLGVEVSPVFGPLVKAYQWVAQAVVAVLFGWISIQLQPWHKDAICLWLLLGEVTFRTLLHVHLERKKVATRAYIIVGGNAIIAWFVEERWRHYLLLPLCLLLWPILLLRLCWEPVACEARDPRCAQAVLFLRSSPRGYEVLYNVRVVFAFQFAAIVASALTFLGINHLLSR
jgi:hypothetical protein